MRCDMTAELMSCSFEVSIHTPTWGVTTSIVVSKGEMKFQSTHLHEVWLPRYRITSTESCFNPHTYMRCDSEERWRRTRLASFNPHTYMRCDSRHWAMLPATTSFNPHTYMRCDSAFMMFDAFLLSFNPHTYMRCDLAMSAALNALMVSIHTPTWGVTLFKLRRGLRYIVSIHTPTWGVTEIPDLEHCGVRVSIHTPTWGVTAKYAQIREKREFQSTHLHEVWRVTWYARNCW